MRKSVLNIVFLVFLVLVVDVKCQISNKELKAEHRGLDDNEGIQVQIDDVDSGSGGIRPIRQSQPQSQSKSEVPQSLSLQELILVLMAKHGEARTAAAFQSLDNLSLGQVMRILLVEVDKTLAADILEMQSYAQNSDKQLVSVIARIVTGDSTVAKDIFAWDEKLRKFPWWLRIRQRIFLNLDKYVSAYDPAVAAATTTSTSSSSSSSSGSDKPQVKS